MMKIRNTNIDQAVVEQLVSKWRKEYPNNDFFLRTKKRNDATVEVNSDDSDEMGNFIMGDSYNADGEKFHYVHQTALQRRLLELYGSEICLMDVTYRTTRYALPLYFICVPSNVNYITVDSFIPETKSTSSLVEVLTILKSWNPKWKPVFFMCDYADEEEINAL
ncbi:unnamed protein product [Mytilus coruscus]|uniref:ZSWIM1/3 RNaseH-like domain-containing protein n=1 Tax=Mytilus coruscus TaxID=42192 RepID=A0A6J7ZYU0_MYTCO|nr:unnamed protein product [Mytilus coruscus]